MSEVFMLVDESQAVIHVGGEKFEIHADNPKFEEAVALAETGDLDSAAVEQLRKLVSVEEAAKEYVADCKSGRLEVRDGVVLIDGVPVHNNATRRMLDMMSKGVPVKFFARFLENLMKNIGWLSDGEQRQSVESVYDFLQHHNMPLTPDGCFIAWKAVRPDRYDLHSGTFYNGDGKVMRIPAKDVNPDRSVACGKGLHVGTKEYAENFGGSSSVLLMVKVNPAHVVSVPHDANAQKCRVTEYTVLQAFEKDLEEAVKEPLYDAKTRHGVNEYPSDDSLFDDDYDDEDDYDYEDEDDFWDEDEDDDDDDC